MCGHDDPGRAGGPLAALAASRRARRGRRRAAALRARLGDRRPALGRRAVLGTSCSRSSTDDDAPLGARRGARAGVDRRAVVAAPVPGRGRGRHGVVSIVAASAGGAALIALFSAALRASRTGVIVGGRSRSPASRSCTRWCSPPSDGYLLELLLGLLVTVVVVGWGLFVRARRELVLSLRERAARLEAEQRLRVEQAREAERRRIAREMHDVLAHRVSLLSLHAGALEFRPDAPPEEVAEAAGVVRASAHAALRGAARGDRRAARGRPRGPPEPPAAHARRDPRARRRVARGGDAGRAGSIDAPGDAVLPAALGRTAYRIVQEGLTNARKHAPAAAVEVTVAAGRATACASRSSAAARSASPRRRAALPGAGTGLDRARRAGRAGRRRARARPRRRAATSSCARRCRGRRERRPRPARRRRRARALGPADDARRRGADRGRRRGRRRPRRARRRRPHRPDVVLMDIRMPSSTASPPPGCCAPSPTRRRSIVLTTFDADELVLRALRAGAAGFLLKDTPPAEIVRAIELVHAGDGMLSPARDPPADRARRRRRRRRRAPRQRREQLSGAQPARARGRPRRRPRAGPTPRSPPSCT